MRARKHWQLLSRALSLVTEPCEFIKSMHDSLTAPDTKGFSRSAGVQLPAAMPKDDPNTSYYNEAGEPSRLGLGGLRDKQFQRKLFKRRGYRAATCQDRLNELYEWHGNLDASVAVENFLLDQLKDLIFGATGALGGKASARLGNRTGRLAGIETGPLH